ncbi:MAG: HAMP domain-containing protein [Candidatus Dadabacteria bacterium]|nr:MAG: HAMP domain-containing protein [Candidatus Dadabacteria bacterium]
MATTEEAQRRERQRRLREGLVIVATGAAVLVFALWEIRRPGAHAGAPGNVFSFLLVNLNIILLLLLVYLVVRNLAKLFIERRRNVPGAKLRTRTVLAFVTIALFPAVVMLLVSLEFMTNTIDSWFNREVDSALRGAWQVAQAYYGHAADDAVRHARAIGEEIAAKGGVSPSRDLERLVAAYQQRYGLGTVQVFNARGEQAVAVLNPGVPTGLSLKAEDRLLAEALAGRPATGVESLAGGDVIRGGAPIMAPDGKVLGAVVVDYFVEQSARRWNEEILAAFREYRRLKLNRRPFKNLYVLTMVLASLVVVFSATWLGLHLARGITEPLGKLVAATRSVAQGDWDVELPPESSDEIGTLVAAFRSMTEQLRASHAALDERRRYIENVLENVDAGVVSVDEDGTVSTFNPAAARLLGLERASTIARPVREVLSDAGLPGAVDLLDDLEAGRVASGARRTLSTLDGARTLLVTVTRLDSSMPARGGIVLFFEDVSQIAEIQRIEAWKEVARRIAHEIKNPLTPIQLSAQRLNRRLRERFAGDDALLFDECTTTISNEVERLRDLVNEFSRFARQPTGEKRPLDLNRLVDETLPLYQQARGDVCVRAETEEGLPVISANREAVKRALVNLLDNAIAAVGPGGEVVVATRFDRALSRVVLEVRDNGPGVPLEHRARLFEPYFSTKSEGTGLGLAIVASVAAEHQAFVRFRENLPRGSRFLIEFPLPGDGREAARGAGGRFRQA